MVVYVITLKKLIIMGVAETTPKGQPLSRFPFFFFFWPL